MKILAAVLLSAACLFGQYTPPSGGGGGGGGGGADPCSAAITAVPTGLHCRTVTLAQADILALDTVPFVIVPAPGAGLVAFPFALRWKFTFNAFPYVSADTGPTIWWGNRSNPFQYITFGTDTSATEAFITFIGLTSTRAAYFSGLGVYPQVSQGGGADPAAYTNTPIVLAGNSPVRGGPMTAAAVNAAGTAYRVGALFTVADGSSPNAVIVVNTIGAGGAVTAMGVQTPGTNCLPETGDALTHVGNITSSTLNAGGLGYAPGDAFSILNDAVNATGAVDTVGAAGVVLTYHLVLQGAGFTSASGVATTTTGAGTGLTLDITAGEGSGLTVDLTVQPGDGTLTVTTWYVIAPA